MLELLQPERLRAPQTAQQPWETSATGPLQGAAEPGWWLQTEHSTTPQHPSWSWKRGQGVRLNHSPAGTARAQHLWQVGARKKASPCPTTRLRGLGVCSENGRELNVKRLQSMRPQEALLLGSSVPHRLQPMSPPLGLAVGKQPAGEAGALFKVPILRSISHRKTGLPAQG